VEKPEYLNAYRHQYENLQSYNLAIKKLYQLTSGTETVNTNLL